MRRRLAHAHSAPRRPERSFAARAQAPSAPLAGAATDVLTIADVTEFYGTTSGGIRTYLNEKAHYVAERPHLRQVLLVPGAADAVIHSPGVTRYELHGPRVPGAPPYRFMLAVRSSRRILRREAPHVIEVGSPGLVPWLTGIAARGMRVPKVYVHHSHFPRIVVAEPERASAPARLTYAALNRYARLIDRLCDVTVACSAFAERELHRAGVSRVVRVPLGVDLNRFHPERRPHWHETRSRLRLPDGPLAAFVGRFSPDKQVQLLVEAWPRVYAATGMRLALMGDGALRASIERQVAGTRWGFVLPFEHDRAALADFMASVDVCVAPSAVETFGLAALEALASGTPIVAAHGSGAGELAERADAGETFEPNQSSSLAEAVITLAGRDLAAYGTRGRRYAELHHTWRGVFDRMTALYRELIEVRG